ncbi:galanin receptor 2b-like [Branchiostoma lanceolatum]|uniref:galanin receptor 2b-like n=1 Tax=Branchiostoma lanceolatum TaxID=7740 RepID=UPI00345334BC
MENIAVTEGDLDRFFTNVTNSSEGQGMVEQGPESWIIPVIFTVIFCVGVFGNALVIVVLLRTGRELENTTNIFILSLSIADLLFIVFCVPFQATVFSLPEWVFGLFMCKFVHFFQCATMLASAFNLMAMSMDRYMAIVHPVDSIDVRKPQVAWAVELAVWVLAMAISTPYLVYFDIHHDVVSGIPVDFCVEHWDDLESQRPAYFAGLFALGYMLPLVIIAACYYLVVRELNSMPKKSQANRSKKRVTKILMVVVIVFGICWLPHHVVNMWVTFGEFPYNMATYVVKLLSMCMAYVNSCVNPIIYAFLSSEFRQGVGELACRT